MFLNSINYFRAVAIIFIVAGHCLGLADFSYQTIPGKTIWNLTVGGTTFFVFISGFLFHHVFYKRFQYKKFILKKISFVLVPYLIMSILPIVYFVFIIDIANKDPMGYYTPNGEGWFSFYFIPTLKYIITGHTIGSFWYIPFIIVVFTPVYLIGIIFSKRKELIYSWFEKREFYLLVPVIIFALVQALITKSGVVGKSPFTYGGFDLLILQKIIFSIFFMVWLQRLEKREFKILNLIATNSFGGFFIHGVLILGFYKIKGYFDISFPSDSFFIYILVVIAIFSMSLGLTHLVRNIFPKHSRYLVGS